MEGLLIWVAVGILLLQLLRRKKPKGKGTQPGRASGPIARSASEPGNLVFVYEDYQGNLTTREVSNWNASARYIKGYCLTRNALRTFRRDRVVEFLDGEHLLEQTSEPKATPGPRNDSPLEVLFTGFDEEDREELEEEAELEGLKVRKSLTQNLDFLCAGPNAGSRKLAEARDRGVMVLSEEEFLDFLSTGALPD